MIRSMTGFARATQAGDWGVLTLELRSVNHRYLDLKLVVPDGLRPLEAVLRERLRARLARGRVEAVLRWQARAEGGFSVNRRLAREVADAARALAAEADLEAPPLPDAVALLAWPGVVETASPRLDALTPVFEALSDEAIVGLIAAREREGAALADALATRLHGLLADAGRLRAEAPAQAEDLKSRFAARLEALGGEVDAARIAQEAALLLVRQDVSEELDRLLAHAEEALRLIESDEAVGRRLDFLMQDLAREANTLASKVGTLAESRKALDFKVLVEEMREQVQNVE